MQPATPPGKCPLALSQECAVLGLNGLVLEQRAKVQRGTDGSGP